MNVKKTDKALSNKLQQSLRKLGEQLKIARIKRKMTQQDVANLICSTKSTIHRLEKGEPGVGIGTLAAVLDVFQMEDSLLLIADPDRDRLGNALMGTELPNRVKSKAHDKYDF